MKISDTQEISIALPKISGRMDCFDELKGVAIVFIVLFHAGGVLFWNNYFHGDLGTDLFFLISGICLSLSSEQMHPTEFLVRRVVRILPTYLIILTGFVLLNATVLGLHYSPGVLFAHYLCVHAFFGDAWAFSISEPMWFITAILCYYVGFLALRSKLEKLDVFFLITGMMSCGGVLLLFFLGQGGLMGRWGFRMPDFFMGMVIGHALHSGKLVIPVTPLLGIALFFLLYLPYTRGIFFHTGVVALGVMVIFTVTLRPWLRKSRRGSVALRSLGFLGNHSLEIFLIHQPLMREYNMFVQQHWFGVSQPDSFELIEGIVFSVAVTILVSVELHSLTRRFAKIAIERLSIMWQRLPLA